MHDFRAKEAKEMQAGALADRVHELKETEKGVEHMCKEMLKNVKKDSAIRRVFDLSECLMKIIF